MKTQPFLIYPANQAYLEKQIPQPVQVPKPWSLVAMLVLILVIGAISVGLAIGAINIERENELFQNADETIAIITGQRTSYTTRGGNRYRITYRYTVEDQIYYDSQTISRMLYNNYSLQDKIKIRYAVEDPTYTRLQNAGDKNSLPLIIFSSIAGLIALYNAYSIIKHRRHSTLLKRDAIVIDGTLLNSHSWDHKGVHWMRVEVTFRNPYLTEWVKGQRVYTIEPNTPQPQNGVPVAIYYHNNDVWEVL